MEVRTLTDGAVVLSPPGPADVDAITEACRDPLIARWTTVPSPYTRADALHFVEDVVPAGWTQGRPDWAVRTAADGVLCGMVGFVPRVAWRAFVGNRASAAVARRVGFRYEGIARNGLLQRGVPRDVWVAGLSADDPPGHVDGWPL